MSIDTFLHQLQYDPDKCRPANWEVNWDDAPLPYKLYVNLPRIQLCSNIPLSFETQPSASIPRLKDISHFLWYVYGLTQMSQSQFMPQQFRRFVPSGGALYPTECYIYLNIDELSTGIYHYDVAHHKLVLLREGNFDHYLTKALGHHCDLSTCFGAVIITSLFWKNFFKYHNFAYRLQGLDAGAVIGQLLETAECFRFDIAVYFQFLDQAINHLLGVDKEEESAYAVIPLSVDKKNTWFSRDSTKAVLARDLSNELEPIKHRYYNRSQQTVKPSKLNKVNQASMLLSSDQFQQISGKHLSEEKSEVISLPVIQWNSFDFSVACKGRYSPSEDFCLQEVHLEQLATLLQKTIKNFSYHNDLDGEMSLPKTRLNLACCLYDVEGVKDGAYLYDSQSHTLRLHQVGDHRYYLQQALTTQNLNLCQVPLCFHILGDRNHLMDEFGYRGYRIQQMEVGILLQRLLLVAAALGMNGHPLLGFDVNACDQLYQLKEKTCLIQIPIGFCRPRKQLVGNLN